MNIWTDPNFIIQDPITKPDQVDSGIKCQPHDDFIVSRDRKGEAASRYKDNIWDLSAYESRGRICNINFEYWVDEPTNDIRKKLVSDLKIIIFGLMWLRKGAPISIHVIQNYLTVAKKMARYCESNSLSIKMLLIDEKRLWAFVESQSGWVVETLGSFLTQLVTINFEFPIVGEKFRKAIRARRHQYRSTLSQHPPIPTRIYSTIIQQLNERLLEWIHVEEDMLKLIKACINDCQAGRTTNVQQQIAWKYKIEFRKSPDFFQLATPKCLDYIERRGLKANVLTLGSLIGEISVALKLTIQLFSGMRDGEAFSLPFHCIEKHYINGKAHCIIIGRTTKSNHGLPQTVRWVTNDTGFQAIQIAQRLFSAIYSTHHIDVTTDNFKKNYYPLFLSLKHVGISHKPVRPLDGVFTTGDILLSRMKWLSKQLEPIIEDTDIQELEMIDPHRAWRAESEFQPGQKWKFTSHQLRRSLALYAQRSGLVTLPSLRRQLQHITNEMSLYYSRGSIYAKDFINQDESHMAQLWQETQSESAGLSYIKNVLLSKDILYGGHASWIMAKLQQPDGTISFDREKTLQSFKRGEIFYKETLIGGCTNRESCSLPALKWINTECLSGGCKNLVCSMSKLEKVILAQQKIVGTLDPDSLEFRSEKADLDVLISAKEKALSMSQQRV